MEKSATESTCTDRSVDEDEDEGKVWAKDEATVQHGLGPIASYGGHHRSHGAGDGVDNGKNTGNQTPPLELCELNLMHRPAPAPSVRSVIIEETHTRAGRLENPLEEAHGLAHP